MISKRAGLSVRVSSAEEDIDTDVLSISLILNRTGVGAFGYGPRGLGGPSIRRPTPNWEWQSSIRWEEAERLALPTS